MAIIRSGYAKHRRTSGSSRREQEVRKLVVAQAAACWYCGDRPTVSDPFEAAHVVAFADGGADTWSNYRAAHRSCNRRAGR